MKRTARFLTRIVGLTALPALAYLSLYDGSEAAANVLPFLAWLNVTVYSIAFAVVMIVSATDIDGLSDISRDYTPTPRWFKVSDGILTAATVSALATHAWYWTAVAVVLGAAAEYMTRVATVRGVAEYRRTSGATT